MFGYKDISIDFLTGSPVLCWLALVVLVGLSVYLYLRTNPPLPLYLRLILGILRVVAVLALGGALLEPVISYTRELERPPRVSLLVDASSSMSRLEAGKSRRERVDSLLSTPAMSRLDRSVDLTTYYFGDSLGQSAEGAGSDRTALGEALYELEGREMADVSDYRLVLSDGKSNAGRDPVTAVSATSVPVVTVGMATDVGNFDVGLTDVDFNTVLFVGRPTEIKAKLNWHNAAGKTVGVELREGEKVIIRRDFPIEQEGGLGEVALRYVPEEPGQKLLEVAIPELDQEESSKNNARTIAVKVLKSKIEVLLVSEGPDYELGFLKRYLSRSDRYDVELRVLGPRSGNLGGRFPDRQTELNRFDLVILHDIDPRSIDGREQILNSYLSDRGGALWVLMGEKYAARGPVEWFNRLLPFYQSRRQAVDYREFRGEPDENELFHPVVRLAEDRTSIREIWSTLPPFKSLVRCDIVDPESVVLVHAGLAVGPGQRLPAIGYRRFGPGKVIAAAALPFWFWGYVNSGFGEDGSNYGRLLDGTINWLTVTEDFDPVRVAPVKEVFNRGETVVFDGVAFDQGFRPMSGVSGTVQMTPEGQSDGRGADLIEVTDGRFVAEFSQLPPGTYRYSGHLEKDGRVLKENSGLVKIESFSLEDYDQSGDPSTLRALSRRTGGEYFDFTSFDQAVAAIATDPIRETIVGERSIWNSLWLLVIFVVALGVEWGVRKLNHLL